MRKALSAFVLLLVIVNFSCKKGKELTTESGFKYILYTESKGKKAEVGNYITLIMVYKNAEDSVLFDSRINGMPMRFRLERIPFKGSYEDGLMNLSENDSATFFVPADSLYEYLYKSHNAENISQDQTAFAKGSFLKFEIKLLRIQTEVEAEEEMMMKASDQEKKERVDLHNYVNRKKIAVAPDSLGYYFLMREHGNGEAIDSGKVVTVEYEGRFLNDSVFDGTKLAGRPYRFISGAHHVIEGWAIVMKDLRAGDKFSLILPSALAYGSGGISDPNTGKVIVPPYSPVAFDIDIVSVEDAPAVSGK